MKEEKQILFAIGIVLAIAFLYQYSGLFTVYDVGTIYKDTDTLKYQYSGEIPAIEITQGYCSSHPSYSENNISFTEEKIVNTEKSSFKFLIKEVHQVIGSYQGRANNPNEQRKTASITFKAEVFKDGILIDTLNPVIDSEFNYFSPSLPEQRYYRAYSDDGFVYNLDTNSPMMDGTTTQVKLPSDKTGINAIFGLESLLYHSPCRYQQPYASIRNEYEIVNTIFIEETNQTINETESNITEKNNVTIQSTSNQTTNLTDTTNITPTYNTYTYSVTDEKCYNEICQEVSCSGDFTYKSLEFCESKNNPKEPSNNNLIIIGILILIGGFIILTF